MTTITSSSSVGLVLSSQPYTNPVVINPGVTISSGGDAVFGASVPWTVQNAGSLEGAGIGVYLQAGGSITNAASAIITGVSYGVKVGGVTEFIFGEPPIFIYGGVGNVINNGSIAGTGTYSDGVGLVAGGSVTNATSASIVGTLEGVDIRHAVGTVVNYGSIAGSATFGKGVYLGSGGSVTNAASASITGVQDGVVISNVAGSVVNDGSIADTGTGGFGVLLTLGGSVTNSASGSITGVYDGVAISGVAGSLLNDGSIAATGTAGNGVALFAGGSVTNAASASITAAYYGVRIRGAAGTVVNDGSIASTGTSRLSRGIELLSGGTVTNAASASITAAYDAISMVGGLGTVVNYGAITGTTASGVYFNTGGSVTNKASASITGGELGVGITYTGTVVNYGAITATGTPGLGVDLKAGGSVTNAASGSITASSYGVLIKGAVGTLVNDGSIAGTINSNGTTGRGVQLSAGGSVTNETSGSITGIYRGVEVSSTAATVVNYGGITATGTKGFAVETGNGGGTGDVVNHGSIAGNGSNGIGVLLISGGSVSNYGNISATGSGGDGVDLKAGGYVTNAASGSITGSSYGVLIHGGVGTVINSGSIAGTGGPGVELAGGGSVTNAASASITGTTYGVDLAAGGALTDGGTIVGNSGTAVVFGGTGSNLLVLEPGYSFSGFVIGSASASNILELAGGVSLRPLTELGTEFINFKSPMISSSGVQGRQLLNSGITVAAGTTLTEVDANVVFTGTVENDGTIVLDPSTMTVAGLVGTGATDIDAGSTLEVQGTVSGGQTITFAGSGAYLHLDSPGSVAGSVTNFEAGETIDLKGVDPTSVQYANGLLSFGGGSFALSLGNGGTVSASASADGASVTVCFLAGTRIMTIGGEVPVERLGLGAHVLTSEDGRALPVRWIGRRRIDARRHPNPETVQPIRIRQGAFGDGVPRRDLLLSPDHAILLDGLLVPARLLANGATVFQDRTICTIEYFHIELDRHAVLFAEGLPAESYLDTGNRGFFENGGAPHVLHPDLTADAGQAGRESLSCAPFAVDAPRVEPLWRRLAARARDLGYGLPEPAGTTDPALRVWAGDRALPATAVSGSRHIFVLPRSARTVRVVSRAAAPSDITPWVDDRRRLGVAIGRIVMGGASGPVDFPVDHPSLADGWWGVESEGWKLWRWTDGDAVLPVLPGTRMLELDVTGQLTYLAVPDPGQAASAGWTSDRAALLP